MKNMKQINFYTEEIIQIKNFIEKLLDENIKKDKNKYEYLKKLLYKKLQEIDMNIYIYMIMENKKKINNFKNI